MANLLRGTKVKCLTSLRLLKAALTRDLLFFAGAKEK